MNAFAENAEARTKRGLLALALSPLDRFAHLDETEIAATRGAAWLRRLLAALFGSYAVVVSALTFAHGQLPSWPELLMLLLALAVGANRGGRFIRDWLPVILGLLAYGVCGQLVERLRLPVHYAPQAHLEQLLFGGHLPTLWLQAHLYHGTGGLLNLFVVVAYASHFLVPPLILFYLWWTRRQRIFNQLIYSLLAVSTLAEFAFVLAPTAPPWLAATHGTIPSIHHILKSELAHLGVGVVASHIGSAGSYNVVAAMPSIHAAFPAIALMVLIRNRLPWQLSGLVALQFASVLFAIVYSGEHYVVDALGGIAVAVAGTAIVMRLMRSEPAEPRVSRPPWTSAGVELGRPLGTAIVASLLVLFAYSQFLSWHRTGHPVGLGLMALELVTAVLYAARRPARQASWTWVAWASTGIGSFGMLLARPTGHTFAPVGIGSALQLAGVALAIAGLSTLGRSFGFVAANRGIRTSGPYRFVRHPVYAGYLLADIGYVLENPALRNLLVAAVVTVFQVVRISQEERLLTADRTYTSYSRRVRFRLVPYLY